MRLTLRAILFVFLALALLQGCKQKTVTKTQPVKVRKPAKAKPTSRPKATKASFQWLVPSYEVIRKALAADDLKAAQAGAKVLAGKAEAATQSALQKAGLSLAGAKDPAAARLAFGVLSKHTFQLLKANAGLKKGLTAYQCPMAKGYKKWLQADANMANPYMGKRMLKCGGKTTFAP
jgi:Cu(I)/Ag(I) efflux system membrane fusion protein